MDVTYPLFMLPGAVTNVTMLADALYTNNESGSGGFFGAGRDRFWHGGVHLCAKDVPIRAIADGEVIAYRMNSVLKEADLGDDEPPRKFSSGFVLIKHKLLTPKGGEIPCFSLYMHLKPMTSAETEQESDVNEAPHIFKKTHHVVADNRHGSGLPVMDAGATEVKGVIPFGAHFVVHPNDDKCKNERYRKVKLLSGRSNGFVVLDPSKLTASPTPRIPDTKGRILPGDAMPRLPDTADTLPILNNNLQPTGKTLPKKGFFIAETTPAPYSSLRYEKVVCLGREESIGFIEDFNASSVRVSESYYRMTADKPLYALGSSTTSGTAAKDMYVMLAPERLPATHWTRVTPHHTRRYTRVKVFTHSVTGFALMEPARAAAVRTTPRNQSTTVLDAAGQQVATLEARGTYLVLGERPAAGSVLEPLRVLKVSYPDPTLPDRIEGYAFLRTGYDYMKLEQTLHDTGNLHLWGDAAMPVAWENGLLNENGQTSPVELKVDHVFELMDDATIPAGHWSRAAGWRKVSFSHQARQGQAAHQLEGYVFAGEHTTVVPAGSPLTPERDQTFKLVNVHLPNVSDTIKHQPPLNATRTYTSRANGRGSTRDFLSREKLASTHAYSWDGKYDGVNVYALADNKAEVLTVLEMGTTVKLKQDVAFQSQLRDARYVWVPSVKKFGELTDGGFIYVDGDQVTKRSELPKPIQFDRVVTLSPPIPIKRGDILGFPGQMDGGEDSFHYEVFTTDDAFTQNRAGDRWGASLARIDPEAKFYLRKTKASTATDTLSLPGPGLVTIAEKDFSQVDEPGGSVQLKIESAPMIGWLDSSDINAETGKLLNDVSVFYKETVGVEQTVQRTIQDREGRERVEEVRQIVQQVKTTGGRYGMTGKKDQVVRVLETKGEAVRIEFNENKTGWLKQSELATDKATNLGVNSNKVYLYELNSTVTLFKENPSSSYEFSEPPAAEKESLKTRLAALPKKRVENKDWIQLDGKAVETVLAPDGKSWSSVKVGPSQRVWFEAAAVKRLYPGFEWLDWQFFQEQERRDDAATREDERSFSKDGFCDIQALLDIVGATNRAESLPKLRRFGSAHPTEWDHQTDASINKWERLQRAPWNYQGERYNRVLDYIKAFQWWDEVGGLPAADRVWHVHPIGFIDHLRKLPLLNVEQLISVFGTQHASRLRTLIEPLCETLDRYEINTPLRIAHFLAQTGAETGVYFYMEEIGVTESSYENRSDLGNRYQGDGRSFIGRGFIQLTGRDNYEAYEKYIREDLTSSRANAETVATMRLAIDSAGFYWMRRNLNAIADNPSAKPDTEIVEKISSIINGGCNGRGVRLHFFKRAKRVLCRDIDA
ncbi:glycoside hydrolase family 19 protein [Archangium lansingense]|uniref:glycoside hydrolase family 19 protein n=1 Tax=Archangium lansingense TaxID=2995310 RepID=UPI003B791929